MKAEGRRSKAERRPSSEIRRPKPGAEGDSGFGLRVSTFFRPSTFGLRICPAAAQYAFGPRETEPQFLAALDILVRFGVDSASGADKNVPIPITQWCCFLKNLRCAQQSSSCRSCLYCLFPAAEPKLGLASRPSIRSPWRRTRRFFTRPLALIKIRPRVLRKIQPPGRKAFLLSKEWFSGRVNLSTRRNSLGFCRGTNPRKSGLSNWRIMTYSAYVRSSCA